jgi:hypothetical protein
MLSVHTRRILNSAVTPVAHREMSAWFLSASRLMRIAVCRQPHGVDEYSVHPPYTNVLI